MENISNILKDTSKLTPKERIQLVNALLESLDNPNEEIDKLWIKESEERYNEYKNDNLHVVDWKEIKTKYKETNK